MTTPPAVDPADAGNPRRRQLGDFLRSRRAALDAECVAGASRRRRRTAGLRREEVAELAGISVDWYIRLEQGRSVNPSIATIDAVARALRLTTTEHEHLRQLARQGARYAFTREQVPETITRMLAQLDQPAYVTGRRWDILAWNRAADDLFQFGRFDDDDRNVLILMLTDPRARELFGPTWADEAQRTVAQFRATHDLWAGDPAFIALLTRLHRDSPEFPTWWAAHQIRDVAAGQKRLHHPITGSRDYEYAAFYASDNPALKLVVLTPQNMTNAISPTSS